MDRVVITRPIHGIAAMQVCAASDATDEEILAVCNKENPSGTTNGWCEVVRATREYAEGPVTCADDNTRTHFLVVC